jgi:hypothetical protein
VPAESPPKQRRAIGGRNEMTLPQFEYYSKIGAALFPIPPGQKNPQGIVTSFAHDHSSDPEQWAKWQEENPGCNFGIVAGPSEIIIVDIDIKDGRDAAWTAWCGLCGEWGIDPAKYPPQVQSASTGWHCYFQVPANVASNNLRQPDALKGRINIRAGNGYTVAAGSTFEGRPYALLNDAKPYTAPDALVDHCLRKTGPVASVAKVGTRDMGDTAALLKWLTEHDAFVDRQDWINAGFALRLEFGDAGLELWKLCHNETVTEAAEATAWQSFDTEPTPKSITLNTILATAHKLGWHGNIRRSVDKIFEGVAANVQSPPIVPERSPQKAAFTPLVQSGAALLKKAFHPVSYVVLGYFAEGCTVLASKPKMGKSWLMLDVALAVATGGTVLGKTAEQGNALYIGLEDNERRLKSRIIKILGPVPHGPERFDYATTWERGDAGVANIRKWIESVERPKLVVVDVLQRFRSPTASQNAYQADYEAITGLQTLAAEKRVAIVVVHHLRKQAADSDIFDKVSGTLGISGAADTVAILDRSGHGITLSGRGRDIEEYEVAVEFDRARCRWKVLGAATEVRRSDERKAILDALAEAGKPLTPSEIAHAAKMQANNVRYLLHKMNKAGEVMVFDGRYEAANPANAANANAERKPIFSPGAVPPPPH